MPDLRLKDLRPCDVCGKKISPIFYRVTIEIGVIQSDAVNRLLGTAQILGGRERPGALTIAHALTGDPTFAKLDTFGKALVCDDCYTGELRANAIPEYGAAGEAAIAAIEAAAK